MIALSYSRWKDADCPHRFNSLHIARTYKEPTGEAALIGQHVATILSAYRTYCLTKNIQSDLEWLLNVMKDKTADKDQGEKIASLLEAFINTNLINIPLAPAWVRVEGKIAFDGNLNPLPEDTGWFDKKAAFRMVADFTYVADKTLWIVDDKTGQGETDAFQVKLYAYLLPKLKKHNSLSGYDRICCVMNELGKRQCNVVGEYAPGDVDDVREEILARLAEVNSWTEYPAKACSKCKWCSVPGCPIRDEAERALVVADGSPVSTIPLAIQSREQAEKAVLFLLHAEKITDQIKDMLRGYVQQNGPVAAGGKIAEERENKPWKATQLERIIKTMIAYGVPAESIWSELSLPESGIEKLAKRFKIKERLPMLLAMGERKDYKPRFGLYNDKFS